MGLALPACAVCFSRTVNELRPPFHTLSHTSRYSVGRITTEPAPREPSDQDFQLKVWQVWAKFGSLYAKCELYV